MRLNELKPAAGSKAVAKRAGRGPGSGLGKTGGRGQKGQKSRSGGKVPVGFEGGQMPLQRRLPKVGFASRQARFSDEVRLGAPANRGGDTFGLGALKVAGRVDKRVLRAKVIATGTIERAITISGVGVSKGARAAIEAAGGRVQEA